MENVVLVIWGFVWMYLCARMAFTNEWYRRTQAHTPLRQMVASFVLSVCLLFWPMLFIAMGLYGWCIKVWAKRLIRQFMESLTFCPGCGNHVRSNGPGVCSRCYYGDNSQSRKETPHLWHVRVQIKNGTMDIAPDAIRPSRGR